MDPLTIEEALPKFYQKNHLQKDGGVNDPSVRIELLKGVYIYIPNPPVRKKIVMKHDIHHILTGYSADMKGETEISAWELSTGCRSNWFAFVINTMGMMSGILFNLPGIWRAWLRGYHSRNLYSDKYQNEELLRSGVDKLRVALNLHIEESEIKGSLKYVLGFIGFLIFGTILTLISFALIPFILIYTLVQFLRNWFSVASKT